MNNVYDNKKIGLALGGGAAFGAAHIGVLRAIDELKTEISFIAGTSIGAFVAALYCFGKNWNKIEEIAREIKWREIAKISLSKYGILSNKKLEDFLEEHIGDVDFSESRLPLAIVATNISDGQKVVIKEGKVVPAVVASTAIPGIFKPVEIKGQMLVDGGIVENVPISPLIEMGADIIIGVDLNAKHSYKKPKNIIEVLIHSFHFTLMTASKVQTEEVDILIKPDLSKFNRTDINQVPELIEVGYKEAKKILATLPSL